MKTLLLAFVIGLSTVSAYAQTQPASLESRARTLTGNEIQALLAGHTLRGVNIHRQPYEETFRPDYTIIGRSVREDDLLTTIVDTGRWMIEGNAMCVIWDHWQDGAKKCHPVSWDGTTYRYADIGLSFTVQ